MGSTSLDTSRYIPSCYHDGEKTSSPLGIHSTRYRGYVVLVLDALYSILRTCRAKSRDTRYPTSAAWHAMLSMWFSSRASSTNATLSRVLPNGTLMASSTPCHHSIHVPTWYSHGMTGPRALAGWVGGCTPTGSGSAPEHLG